MGWQGEGLGKKGQGITSPIKANSRSGREGLAAPNDEIMSDSRRTFRNFTKSNGEDVWLVHRRSRKRSQGEYRTSVSQRRTKGEVFYKKPSENKLREKRNARDKDRKREITRRLELAFQNFRLEAESDDMFFKEIKAIDESQETIYDTRSDVSFLEIELRKLFFRCWECGKKLTHAATLLSHQSEHQ